MEILIRPNDTTQDDAYTTFLLELTNYLICRHKSLVINIEVGAVYLDIKWTTPATIRSARGRRRKLTIINCVNVFINNSEISVKLLDMCLMTMSTPEVLLEMGDEDLLKIDMSEPNSFDLVCSTVTQALARYPNHLNLRDWAKDGLVLEPVPK